MKTLALALATGMLALASPALASNSNTSTGSFEAYSTNKYTTDRTFTYEGHTYEYSKADITISGDIAGGTNTLEGFAARAEASKQATQAFRDMQAKFGVSNIDPNEFLWDDDEARGETRVIVSIDRQLAFVYMGDTLVGAASVTTAREDKLTPQGIFPIWLKKDMHYSQAYDNTPMPYTQFLDKHGIALHAGHNPGYPASAGCVRLPKQFAKKIFAITDIGSTVLIGA